LKSTSQQIADGHHLFKKKTVKAKNSFGKSDDEKQEYEFCVEYEMEF
jgi:hypothetical protein